MEIGVKNDEHLIKLAAIVQRAMQNSTNNADGSLGISDEEKAQLLAEINKIQSPEK